MLLGLIVGFYSIYYNQVSNLLNIQRVCLRVREDGVSMLLIISGIWRMMARKWFPSILC